MSLMTAQEFEDSLRGLKPRVFMNGSQPIACLITPGPQATNHHS